MKIEIYGLVWRVPQEATMSTLTRTIKTKVLDSAFDLYGEYLRAKHTKVDQCMVWGADGKIWFYTEDTAGNFDKDQKVELLIRAACRDAISLRTGPPRSKEYVPFKLCLLPLPSVAKVIGIKRYLNLIKEWPGQTVFCDVSVIEYKVLI